MEEIIGFLFSNRDEKYGEFNSSLNPAIDKSCVIGVRTPVLKKYAKEISGSRMAEEFLLELPHRYFEENQLHAFLISEIKDYDRCIEMTEKFLPYIDNWATCDQLSPKVMKKYPERLIENVYRWIDSEDTYTIRFGIKRLMDIYLDENYREEFAQKTASVRSEEYYVNMMIAWYFATALAKQYDSAVKFIQERRLSEWCHRKTIQKACESFRISDEKKAYLKGLR